jgi:hypothetical protein
MIVLFIRASIVAVVVGSILTASNQFDWIVGRSSLQLLPLILVFLLPFAVVTVGQLVGVKQARIDAAASATVSPESFTTTMVRHGIPARAVVIGLVFGSLNAIIVLANALLHSGDLAVVPLVPLAQAYVLPFLFGALSQTFSYRRYHSESARFDITKGGDSMSPITDR